MSREIAIQIFENGQEVLALKALTQRPVSEIFAAFQELLKVSAPAHAATSQLEEVGKRYRGLAEHLVNQTAPTIRMTFTEVEKILGRPLPASASGEHARSWWANTESHAQGKAWLLAGYKVDFLDAEAGVVEWRKM